ncbi:MAG: copper amine oxidase N-terminal domain-containing protein [Gracilibacteraceae bacterium]|nr:copper amine oxidase N-terminal domain-containing protein [Gracilibacteraceae bacterium]
MEPLPKMVQAVTNGLGYRMFRSTSKSSLGISVTDFYITSTSYADVNVESDTTYYYTVKPVLAEAKPFEGTDEKLGDVIATFTVKTGSQVYKPGSFKHFIMLKFDSPTMSVDGVSQEVDPGRGTSPITISGRTMVPIRAVVEAMGETVEWDGATQKVTLKARGNIVEMWLGKTDMNINGASKKMDVAPASRNGRTFVPVRFAAENLDCKVDWINSTKEAVIVYEE